jgi:uncharacterized RDD family membrane protein YckC
MTYAESAGTPAMPAVEVTTWGRRFGAWLIDVIIMAIPIGIIGAMTAGDSVANSVDPVTGAVDQAALADMTSRFMVLGLISTIVFTLYVVLLHGSMGQTLGKKALGIKVVKLDGSPCDYAVAAKRALVYPIAGIVPYVGGLIALLNGLWPLWDSQRQSLGDKVGGTYVVKA